MPSVGRVFISIDILDNSQFLVMFRGNDTDLIIRVDFPAFINTPTACRIIHRMNVKSARRWFACQFTQFLTKDLLQFQSEPFLIAEENYSALGNFH
jgi:hypothetical protein